MCYTNQPPVLDIAAGEVLAFLLIGELFSSDFFGFINKDLFDFFIDVDRDSTDVDEGCFFELDVFDYFIRG